MKFLNAGVLLALLLMPRPGNTAPEPISLNSDLQPLLEAWGAPAIAAAVAKNGEVVAAGAVGRRRVDSPIQVTLEDRFHIGSDTKAMTALLAAMLVEGGQLRWDSTLEEVFPELKLRMDPGLQLVTLKQLLSHTSGLPEDNQDFVDLIEASMVRDGNLDELRYWILEQWCVRPLDAQPGTRFAYSNLGYLIAGVIIERKMGRTWEEIISERVFDALDLKTAGLGYQATLGRTDAPLGHMLINGQIKPFLAGPSGDNPQVIGPAGIAHMSVVDFVRWASWNAGEGKRGPALVSAETLKALHTPVIELPPLPDAPPGTPREGKYAMGWGQVVVDWAPRPVLYHTGSNEKNLAHAWIDPEADLAIVVVANLSNEHVNSGMLAEVARLYQLFAANPTVIRARLSPDEPNTLVLSVESDVEGVSLGIEQSSNLQDWSILGLPSRPPFEYYLPIPTDPPATPGFFRASGAPTQNP